MWLPYPYSSTPGDYPLYPCVLLPDRVRVQPWCVTVIAIVVVILVRLAGWTPQDILQLLAFLLHLAG